MARTHTAGDAMRLQGPSYFAAAAYWTITVLYAVLASQAFIQEQFLGPRLFAPLAFFADWHAATGLAMLSPWVTVRLWGTPDWRAVIAAVTSVVTLGVIAVAAPLSAPPTAFASILTIAGGLCAMATLVAAEWTRISRSAPLAADAATDRTAADLAACLLAALAAAVAHSIASAVADAGSSAAGSLANGAYAMRVHLLLAGGGFLCLAMVRAAAALWPARRVSVERVLTAGVMATALASFLFFVVLASISIRGTAAMTLAVAIGTVVAFAAVARGGRRETRHGDGVAAALSPLAPGVSAQWWGFALWMAGLTALAIAVAMATRTADWNFVAARTGVVVTWTLALAGAMAVTRRITAAATALSFAVPAVILVGHLVLPAMRPSQAGAVLDSSTRWIGEILDPAGTKVAGDDIVDVLHARTNIPRGTAVAPVDVSLAPLAGEPSAERPHIFVFVVDSLRRDYLSPYNPAVTFTPSIAALAADSLVFRNAFTQYGATGLSIPSLWVGGPILHKQYVTPFAPMNSLAKLLAHERYTQWIGMDNIMDVILPASASRDRLDHSVAVKDFRMCRTLADIRSRFAAGVPEQPVFVYALPQDVHVSVVAREGALPGEAAAYDGFYAPVASRVARLDACLGDFVADLKARGLYEQSVIVLTSDHGDSLGEEGRMGHAYSLHPEVVRVPLIVHVPAALRAQWTWDEQRVAFTTDVTPTLYRLLGHETHAPAPFFGEPLAHPPGVARPPAADRMVAASYGAVYGAVLDGGRRYYVLDAIAMKEMAFSLGADASPGQTIAVTSEMQQRGLGVIRRTVDDISRFYRYPPSDHATQLARHP